MGAFAARVGLVAQRLYWWRDRLSAERRARIERPAPALGLAELVPIAVRSVSVPTPARSCPVEVIADGSAAVRLMVNELSPAAAAWVATLLRSLGDGEVAP